MNTVSNKTRILHFLGGLFYLFFFLGFYTLPALNLHAVGDIKSFLCAFFFPFVLLVILFVRLFMERYPISLFMLFVSKSSDDDYETGNFRKIFWFFNFLAFLFPLTLISFDLHKNELHSEEYFQPQLILCISAAAIGFISGLVILFRLEKKNKLINKLIAGTFMGAVFAASAWWAVCELWVMYEMIFLHPEVFTI